MILSHGGDLKYYLFDGQLFLLLRTLKNPIERIVFCCFTDKHDILAQSSNISSGQDFSKGNALEDSIPKQLVLICSEKAVYVYSLTHVIQVICALFI